MNDLILFIPFAASLVGYVIAETSAVESYFKLFLKFFKKTSPIYDDRLMTRVGFWMKLGMKYPDSFLVSLGSCGICSTIFSSIFLGVLSGVFNPVLLFTISWFSVLLYSVLVYIVNFRD